MTSSYNPSFLPVLVDSEMHRNGYVEIGYLPYNTLHTNISLHNGERAILRKTGDTIFVSIPRTQDYAVAHQNVYVVKDKVGYSMLFWMGLLNSKLLSFLYQNGLYGQKGRTMAQFRIYALNALPCPGNIDEDTVRNVELLVLSLLECTTPSDRLVTEMEIDEFVYKLYGLSDADIKAIEQSI